MVDVVYHVLRLVIVLPHIVRSKRFAFHMVPATAPMIAMSRPISGHPDRPRVLTIHVLAPTRTLKRVSVKKNKTNEEHRQKLQIRSQMVERMENGR